MVPIAPHEQDDPSHAPNEERSHSAHGIYRDEAQSETRDWGEEEGQGTVADLPSEAPPEDASGGDPVGEDVHSTIRPPRSRGEWSGAGNTLAHIELR